MVSFIAFLISIHACPVFCSKLDTESNKSLNPIVYDTCIQKELDKLTRCRLELPKLLRACQPNDSVCSCCALQPMDNRCYKLCPSHESSLFSVLLSDCRHLSDVNASNLPTKSDVASSKLKFSEMAQDMDITSLQFDNPTTSLQASNDDQRETSSNTASHLSADNSTNGSLTVSSGGTIPFTVLKNHSSRSPFLKSSFNFSMPSVRNYSNIRLPI